MAFPFKSAKPSAVDERLGMNQDSLGRLRWNHLQSATLGSWQLEMHSRA